MKTILSKVLLLAGLLLSSAGSYAIAFCDLRDPTHQIFDLYPEATAYRSIVEVVDKQIKQDVGAQLPFTLHNRELGKHTLYLALKEDQTLGLVHVRSEASDWGLIEVVWSLGLDLKVRDFTFQRCRESGCQALNDEAFKANLRGKDLASLRKFVGDNADGLSPADLGVASEHINLARAVIRSALKTLLVTDLVWGEQLAKVG